MVKKKKKSKKENNRNKDNQDKTGNDETQAGIKINLPNFVEIKENWILIHVYVKPNSRIDEVKMDDYDPNELLIKTSATPIKGKANKAVIKILSKYLDINSNNIEIIAGHTSQKKILKIYCQNDMNFKDFLLKIGLILKVNLIL